MKITFFSNYLNHHQIPLALALDKLTDGNFTFVATDTVSQERLDLGYRDVSAEYPFVLDISSSPLENEEAMKLALESDVVITGSAPECYTLERVKHNKITFRYSERPLKVQPSLCKLPRLYVSNMLHHGLYQNKPLYMLCASCYTAGDYQRFGCYTDKAYRWGYFTEVVEYNYDNDLANKHDRKPISILWVGRLMDVKHPECFVALAEFLSESGYDFTINVIGIGPKEEAVKQAVIDKGLSDRVIFHGSMSPENVRRHMEDSSIFMFTSDFREGWGAVLSEAMNSGCAVVSSHAIGSAGFLLEDGVNGLLYKNGDQQSLNFCVKKLIDNPSLRKNLGRNAYRTISETWNADNAAQKFLELCEYLHTHKKGSPFVDGPCSISEILDNKNSWHRLTGGRDM